MTVRATVLGYQGFGNVGDEAILTGIERLLDGLPIRVEAVICGPQAVAGFPTARRITTRRLRPNLAAIRSLRRSRVLLLSGGGLLHDHWWTVLPLYLSWVLLARLLGARVIWLGVGVGPLRSRRSRLLASWALRLSHLVLVRDPESASLVSRVAPRGHVMVIPDPAVFNTSPSVSARSGIGLIVRAPAPDDARHTGPLVAALAETVARLTQRGLRVTVMTFGGAPDRPIADAVVGMATQGVAGASFTELEPRPDVVLHRLGGLEAVITVRLHGLILAAAAGTPAAAIAYDPKVSAWASRLGAADAVVGLEDADADQILLALDRCRSGIAASTVRDRIEAMRAEAPDIRRTLTAAL